MSMYIFAVKDGAGVPDIKLLKLMANRIDFKKILCSPEEDKAGLLLSQSMGIDCEISILLSEKQEDETDREFEMRLRRIRQRASEAEESCIMLVSAGVFRILTNMPFTPEIGYSEVI